MRAIQSGQNDRIKARKSFHTLSPPRGHHNHGLSKQFFLALDSDVSGDAFKDETGGNLRQLFWLHFVQPTTVYPAFGDKLAGSDAPQRLKYLGFEFRVVSERLLQAALRVE